MVSADPALRKAIATGLDNPVATASSRTRTAARSAVAGVVGRAVELGAGLVVLVVGATDVGAVDGAARGESLPHAPSTRAAAMTPINSLRTEPRVGRVGAYDPSPARSTDRARPDRIRQMEVPGGDCAV